MSNMTNPSTHNDDELFDCFCCGQNTIVNKNSICSTCAGEVRSIEDTWLVQEFKRRHDECEVAEAVEQIKQSLLPDLITQYRATWETGARIDELEHLGYERGVTSFYSVNRRIKELKEGKL